MTDSFELIHTAHGYASFRDGKVELTRLRPGHAWEFYKVIRSGESRGLPMFVRYLTDAEGERLTKVLDSELAMRRLRGIKAA